jgi:sigma-B regulation protein RsbU (phosphoserine phosphatase)
MIRPKSLQRRFAIFMLLPVALLLILMGFAGFIYAREILLNQWQEAAILKLERAAHQVDMRLSRIKELIRMFHNTAVSQVPESFPLWLIEQLQQQKGVAVVRLMWNQDDPLLSFSRDKKNIKMPRMDGRQGMMGSGHMQHMRHFHRGQIRELTPPRYDASIENETVSLVSDLIDENGQSVGKLEVVIKFDFLIENIKDSGWWQSHKALLIDNTGKILADTMPERRETLLESGDELEKATFEAIKSSRFGTVLGKGHPPSEVSGYYRLEEAPWSVVMIAPGKQILSPIVRFRLYYFLVSAGFIMLILILIRTVTGRTVAAIRRISQQADSIARGNFGKPLAVKSRDEVGELTYSFNTMVSQLRERLQLKEELNLAMEVQQNLLPKRIPRFEGLDIAGKSVYCDETGGDFYDFIDICCEKSQQLGIAVGDVAGHGISTALMMATVRAFLRSRVTHPGSISEVVADVNRLVVNDTEETGQFMTLFYLTLNPAEKSLSWVRAGHDPAFIYDPKQGKIAELNGNGAALGISEDAQYQQNSINGLEKGQVLLIGTDGLWETQNTSGEMFGKERLKALISKHAGRSAEEIITLAIDSLAAFRDSARQEDDITLVVVKAEI